MQKTIYDYQQNALKEIQIRRIKIQKTFNQSEIIQYLEEIIEIVSPVPTIQKGIEHTLNSLQIEIRGIKSNSYTIDFIHSQIDLALSSLSIKFTKAGISEVNEILEEIITNPI